MGNCWKLAFIFCLLNLFILNSEGVNQNDLGNTRIQNTEYITFCDFNNNSRPLCDWKQSYSGNDHGDWIRALRKTPTCNTGPNGDYPNGTGYYLYQEASNLIPNDVVRLDSPFLTIAADVCVDFWYHMYGQESYNELRVLVSDDGGESIFWQRSGNQSSSWLYGSFTVQTLREKKIQVIFEAVRGLTENGDTAIDNIGVRPGPCELSTAETITTITTSIKPTSPVTIPGGTCSGYGDPHYFTFDNYPHTFMGNCTYTLTKLCEENSTLPYFNVEVGHEYRDGNTYVSYVKQVTVFVYNYIISLEKKRIVKVNGQTQTLPQSLSPGISIGLTGQYAAVTVDFGLKVKYDGDHRVEVTLSKVYQGKVCGICANFNDKRGDDNLNPAGQREDNSISYGNSWQVPSDSSCTQDSDHTFDCTDEERHEIESYDSCGFILPFESAFKHCHLIVDPREYFINCYYDMCALRLDPQVLCNNIQAYADACQEAGAVVLPWRNETFCPLPCPPNSHYEQCGTACPATCVNPGSPSSCNLPCAEGCVCDPGYVLYNNKCVPSGQCGCWDGDKHYPVGSEFWTDDTCSTKCNCPSQGSGLVCKSATCPPGTFCGISNGVPGCYDLTFGSCTIYGDPHYTSFDKETHHFMGICTYTLSKVCSNTTSLPYFNVEAKNEHRGNPTVSYVQKVKVEVYNHQITIVKNEPNRVQVDGIWTTLPVSLINGSLTVTRSGRYILVETDFRLTVSYDTDHTVEVKVPTTYFNQTCGICGNLNSIRQDDFMMPNGQQAQNSNELGNSWQVDDDDPSCTPVAPPPICPPEKEDLYETNEYCGLIASPDGPFKACHSVINPNRYLESCVFDLCVVGEAALCTALEAYADACQKAGVSITWRNATFCSINCPINTHYNPCASACPATCLDQNTAHNCSKPCVEACECKDGFVLSGNKCVPVTECGCFYNGKYHEKGEIFWQGECESQCKCIGNNQVECSDKQCTPNQICKVVNGVLGCYPADSTICHIHGDPHYITFDGKLYHFQGSCNYTAAETCKNSSVNFSVTTRNEHRGSLSWTALNSVAVRIENLHIILGKQKVVYVDGKQVSLPATPAPGISISIIGSYVVLQTNFGLEVKFNGDHELFVKVSEHFKGQLCGLCGTYTEDILDDFLKPNGLIAQTSNEFGNSWRVPDKDWVCEEDVVDPPPCNPVDEKEYEEQCKIILSTDGPFKDCHFYIPPQIYFESCVYDQCATGGNLDQFCNALEAYAAACESAGVNLGNWKDDTVCDLTPSTPKPIISTTTAQTPSTPKPIISTTTDPGTQCPLACSFDVDLCQWRQSKADNMDWIRLKGPTPSDLTGPDFDHTTGDGYYIYIDGQHSEHGDFARLEGPVCELNRPHCLRLWYHMYGDAQEMRLEVYVVGVDGLELVSLHEGNQGDLWHLDEIFLPNSGTVQIFIDGFRGESYRSDVAVDDISLLAGYCPGPTTSTLTTTTRPPIDLTSSTPKPIISTTTGTTTTTSSSVTTSTTKSTPSRTTTPAPLPPGSCEIHGDPHYHTFDNQIHHFMGTCTYTLSKVCEDDGQLPHFNVEAANEHRGSNTKVSYVKYVNVDVYGYRITLEKDRQVKVDGLPVILPVTLSPGVNIFLSGNNVLVTTIFGLRVSFDGNHRVVVTVPGNYANKVCGICGNFNGNVTDDFLNPDGELESNSADLGNSWQVENDTRCSPGDNHTPNCTIEDKNTITSNSFCGLIIDSNGPFKECHNIINPSTFFDDCVYDLCELNLDPGSLCRSLQSYAEACQSHGVTIHPWRNDTFCPLQCPPNSHYEQCGTACPATCVNPGSPSSCNLPCAEGCVCDPGYVLYNNKCVPSGQCGCWDGDKHYPVGSEFWTDDTCSTKCNCPSQGSGLVCKSATCPPGTFCGISNGVPGCYDLTFGSCTIYGDPHYTTFDKETHHFMGICTYTLSKVCSNTTSLPYFNVEAKNEHRGNPTVSYVQKVKVEVYNHQIMIVKNEPNRVQVDGIWTTLPVSLVNGSLTVTRSGRYIVVETDFKLTVSYDTDHTVEVKVPTTYFNQTCGICGNLNSIRQDDFMMPNGQQAQNSNELGNSWQVDDDDPSCTPVAPPPICPPEKEDLYETNEYCGLIASPDGPFKACHSVINPNRYLESCVFDLCVVGEAALCTALEAYADACQKAGVSITWRNATFCSINCPINTHYNPCASACPATCLDQNTAHNCSKPCVEACECKDGFVLSGNKCVPVTECGCFYNGKYHEKGEIFWQGECESQCKCIGNNQVECSDKQCTPNQICKVVNGVLGCYPADSTICHIHGDPHYITFDGKLYHFQGSCNYTAAETCKNSSVNFSVTTRNEHRGSLSWTALNSVAVRIENLHIILGKQKVVYVDGKQVSLPATPAPGISISIIGSYVVLQTNFGLEVKFNGDHELFVKVSEHFKGQLCGLCGTYTEDILDDFLKPNGLIAQTSNEFGNSWRVPDKDWVCEEDVVDPPPCNPVDEKEYEEQCKIILSTDGPFKDCHFYIPPQIYFESCVYDQCATGGNLDQFCNALEAYAAACESAGVNLGNWKDDTVCDANPVPTSSTVKPSISTSPTTVLPPSTSSTAKPIITTTALPPSTPSTTKPIITTTALPPSTPSTTKPIITSTDPGTQCPLACSFDVDLCQWRQSKADNMDWIRLKGPTPSDLTGPDFDHTTGDGYYIYIDGQNSEHGDFARLEGPVCELNRPHCLRLWYHMYGDAQEMRLEVYVLGEDGLELVSLHEGNQGDLWHLDEIFILNSGTVQIFIDGVRGESYRSDVAVDDISLIAGYCPGPTTFTTTTRPPTGSTTSKTTDITSTAKITTTIPSANITTNYTTSSSTSGSTASPSTAGSAENTTSHITSSSTAGGTASKTTSSLPGSTASSSTAGSTEITTSHTASSSRPGTTASPSTAGSTGITASKTTSSLPASTASPSPAGSTAITTSHTASSSRPSTTASPSTAGSTGITASKTTISLPGSTSSPSPAGSTAITTSHTASSSRPGTTASPPTAASTGITASTTTSSLPGSTASPPTAGSTEITTSHTASSSRPGTTASPTTAGSTGITASKTTSSLPGSTATPSSAGSTELTTSHTASSSRPGTTASPSTAGSTDITASKTTSSLPGSTASPSPAGSTELTTSHTASSSRPGTTASPTTAGSTGITASTTTSSLPGSTASPPTAGSTEIKTSHTASSSRPGTTASPTTAGSTGITASKTTSSLPGSTATPSSAGSTELTTSHTASSSRPGTTASPSTAGSTDITASKTTSSLPGSTASPSPAGSTELTTSHTASSSRPGTTASPTTAGSTGITASTTTSSLPGSTVSPPTAGSTEITTSHTASSSRPGTTASPTTAGSTGITASKTTSSLPGSTATPSSAGSTELTTSHTASSSRPGTTASPTTAGSTGITASTTTSSLPGSTASPPTAGSTEITTSHTASSSRPGTTASPTTAGSTGITASKTTSSLPGSTASPSTAGSTEITATKTTSSIPGTTATPSSAASTELTTSHTASSSRPGTTASPSTAGSTDITASKTTSSLPGSTATPSSAGSTELTTSHTASSSRPGTTASPTTGGSTGITASKTTSSLPGSTASPSTAGSTEITATKTTSSIPGTTATPSSGGSTEIVTSHTITKSTTVTTTTASTISATPVPTSLTELTSTPTSSSASSAEPTAKPIISETPGTSGTTATPESTQQSTTIPTSARTTFTTSGTPPGSTMVHTTDSTSEKTTSSTTSTLVTTTRHPNVSTLQTTSHTTSGVTSSAPDYTSEGTTTTSPPKTSSQPVPEPTRETTASTTTSSGPKTTSQGTTDITSGTVKVTTSDSTTDFTSLRTTTSSITTHISSGSTTTRHSTTTTTVSPPNSGSCVVEGDPHYHTFDNQVHHFMGTCTYTLSKVCEDDGQLPHFNVEAANEHRGSNTRVSYVKYVNVDVYGYRITLEKDRQVKVNGQIVTLPKSLSPDVEIFLSGSNVLVKTGFGLQVKFDGNHKVVVTIPGNYANKVCGLCGNFNGNKPDDFLNPDGELEPDSSSLGNSWQVKNDSSCSAGTEVTPNCTDEEKNTIASNSFCGLITDSNGPFRECHNIIDPSTYFDTCVYDLCELDLDPGSLCNSLQSYTEACQSHGVTIHPWRNDTFCPPKCPSNSHYEQCGTACPATCVNPRSPSNCDLPCTEGCVCDPGYILYDRKCVPEDQCGCWDGDKYYDVGSEFWSDDTCSSLCTCPSAGSSIECKNASCPSNQYCGISNGEPGCYFYVYGVCRVHNDPHYDTFDRQNHNFMGLCTYTLAKLCSNSSSLPYFNVEAKNAHRGDPSVSFVEKVFIEVYNQKVQIWRHERNRVLVNNIWTTLPVSLVEGLVTVTWTGKYVLLQTDFKLSVSYDTDSSVEVKVPSTYSKLTCGMCGNYNNRKQDDYMMPNGEQAPNSEVLGHSWIVDDDDPLCNPTDPEPTPLPPCEPEEEELYKSNAFCGLLTSKDGPFSTCNSVISPAGFFESCMFDMCALDGDPDILCSLLEAYADACQKEGLLSSWRNSTLCPPTCPPNSHYDSCMSSCPATCLEPHAPENCSTPCLEGCACDDGYVISGGTCVSKSNCGCYYNGTYYNEGEKFLEGNCENSCVCHGNNSVVCSPISCAKDEICKAQDGVLGCYPPSTAICHIYGDPHYTTFDGTLHHFQGSCNYTVTETCVNTSNNFIVTTRNEHRGNPSWTAINSVALTVKGAHIVLQKNNIVQVNNVTVTLPTNLSGISITQTGPYVIVTTDFGLELQFNGDHELFVRIKENFKGTLCGLCGTYNDNRHDDFTTPNGSVVTSVNEFGNSWRVEDDEWLCDPVPPPPPTCTPSLEQEAEQKCWILKQSDGPFKPCHMYIRPHLYFESCVFDQCATGGSDEQLCNALQSYAAACEALGVSLGDWKNNTICDPDATTERPVSSTTHTAPGSSVTTPVSVRTTPTSSGVSESTTSKSTTITIASTPITPTYTGAIDSTGTTAAQPSSGPIISTPTSATSTAKPTVTSSADSTTTVHSTPSSTSHTAGPTSESTSSKSTTGTTTPATSTTTVTTEYSTGTTVVHPSSDSIISATSTGKPTISASSGLTSMTVKPSTSTATARPPSSGSCVVEGDPHYHTFDNQVHHFMGTCTYTLSKVCKDDGQLPHFNVEAANEHRGSNTRVSYVKYVNVDVYRYRITLEKDRQVKVNGQIVTLPKSLSPDVEIFLSGSNVLVKTGFGLQVKFDGNHKVVVTIPGNYANKVCGLCGNFNGNKPDDFLNPEGELEPDSSSLGNSWQVKNDSSCSAGTEVTPNCTDEEKNTIASNSFCGLITDSNGPFRECHNIIDPSTYFDTCVYDLCELDLDPGSLCNSLQSYTEACQSHGVIIHPWRNDTFCPPKCPSNSHYEQCGTACPATCVNPGSPSNCNLPCTEGCVCDPGYILYDRKCVPEDQCGCWDGDKYYDVGSEFWSDDTCSSLCTCPSAGSSIECKNASCPSNQYCGISNGEPGCYFYVYGVCRVHNDPHYDTFDRQNHNFMGLCTYTLAKLCSNSSSLPYFNVEAKNAHRGDPSVSFVEKVFIEVYNQKVQIWRHERNRVLVNNIWTTLPVSLVEGLVTVTWTGKYVLLQTDFKLSVSYDTDSSVEVKVPSTYSKLTCGMCGNYNNRKQDDYMMPNGEQAPNSEVLGHSWIVDDDDPLCNPTDPEPTPLPPCEPEEEELYKSNAFCGLLTSKDGPFSTCNSVISPAGFFESCMFDMCALDGDPDILCSLLEAYADACQKEGLLSSWRNSTLCPPTCPPNSHYNSCMSSCPATCLEPHAPENCSTPCLEGCACDDGYVISGGTCVSKSNCGCYYNGTYYNEGEKFLEGNCENSCVCHGNNSVVCSPISCAKDEICKAQDGVLGCYPPSTAICHIYGDPHYTTFDGTLHHFQGSCNYTVTETCVNTSNNFIVTTRNEHRGNPSWTAINSVALTVKGAHIVLQKNNIVQVNNVTVTLPTNQSGISITQTGPYVIVTTDFGLELQFNGDHELFVRIKENFKGTLCGLCGTYNDNRHDDFTTPNGSVVTGVNEFGNSWRVEDDEWLCDPVPPPPPTCTPSLEQEAEQKCWILKQSDGPFKPCHMYIRPHLYFESCVFDQCATGGSDEQLCNALQSYAAACEALGVSLGDWKNNTICDPDATTERPVSSTTHTVPESTPAPSTRTTTTSQTTIRTTTTSRTPTTPTILDDAICSASGDPHYNTFDGAVHHYMGNCSYTLSKLCNGSQGLSDFHVYTTNEHRGSNTKVSYVQSVHVQVDNDTFTLLKNKKFNVNGIRRNTPVQKGSRYRAYISGNYLIVETDFGLRVKFDGNHYVDVYLPLDYKGHVCGLCGNYNGIPSDDNIKPDGNAAADSRELGDSWIVSDKDGKICGSLDLDICDPAIVNKYSSDDVCGIINNPAGLFKECHRFVNPENYFENCVLDMCFTEGESTSLCYAVQAYAQKCREAGVCIEWRSDTFCPISCPATSQYKSCSTEYPVTCYNSPSVSLYKPLAVEGCFCNDSYVLSGDKCVPKSDCGCIDAQNNFYQLGESWYTHEDCTERCTCNRNNSITCAPWECGLLQTCHREDGVLGCHSSGKVACHVSGDPHYFTFDKVMHSFMGTCTYIIVTTCDSRNVIPLTISGKNEDRGQRTATYLKEIYIDVYDMRITLQKEKKTLIDNKKVHAPWVGKVKGVSIGNVGLYVVVETDFGLMVKFDGNHHLEIILPDSYYNKVCGMCGNFNGLKDDEFLMSNNLQATSVTQFGNSWKSEKDSDKSCSDDNRVDLNPPCTADQKPAIDNQCNVLLSDTFKACHHLIDPAPFAQSCVYDMCRYNGMVSTLCAIFQAYVDACRSQGVNIQWRSSTLCPLACPSHSHYSNCASLCPPTCNDIFASAVCDKPNSCVEGCVCNDGYVLSDNKCVPLKSCGCRDSSDNYYNIDEAWITPHCTQKCQCTKGNTIKCKTFNCPHGICSLNSQGKYNCKPTSYAKCTIAGDPHYRTFDGLPHHFQGRETYMLALTSSQTPDYMEPFKIEGKNEPMTRYSSFTVLKEMRIEVYNQVIVFSQNKKLVVNGIRSEPPIRPHEGIYIYQKPTRIYLETDFGLSASFDGKENGEITIPNTYKNILQGLCGNFDGRSSNDFTRPDGSSVRDVVTFGESWNVKGLKTSLRIRRDTGVSLLEEEVELNTGDNLACSASQLAFVNSTSFCGILRDSNGPFKDCLPYVSPEDYIVNCLYDTCAEFRSTELLCTNLEQYALACQENETIVDGWRQRTGCAMECPSTSQYQSCMTSCPASCSNLASESECEAPCSEGCQCLPGYVLSGYDCVPYKQCGCPYLDKYYKSGEVFYTDDCSQKCTCAESSLVCEENECMPNEVCTTANQIVGCYVPGPCLENPCENGGTCIEDPPGMNSTNGMHCQCPKTFSGTYCEIEDPYYDNTTIYIVIGVVVGVFVISFLFIIAAYFFFRSRRSKKSIISSRDYSEEGRERYSSVSENSSRSDSSPVGLMNIAYAEEPSVDNTDKNIFMAVRDEAGSENNTLQKPQAHVNLAFEDDVNNDDLGRSINTVFEESGAASNVAFEPDTTANNDDDDEKTKKPEEDKPANEENDTANEKVDEEDICIEETQL